jgi:uncharacterized phage-associated protein
MESMEQRSLNEALIDRLLLLYVVTRTRQKGYNILGQIKLQKMLYKVQEQMFLRRYKGLNHTYIRWKSGPFSQEIYSDVRDLKATGLLNRQDAASSSHEGQRLIEHLKAVFDPESKEIIEKVVNEFGRLSGRQIKAVTYSYPVVGKKRTIKEVKEGELILTKLNIADARNCFRLSDNLLETLSVLFNPDANNAIQNGLNALKKEEGKPFIPVRH